MRKWVTEEKKHVLSPPKKHVRADHWKHEAFVKER